MGSGPTPQPLFDCGSEPAARAAGGGPGAAEAPAAVNGANAVGPGRLMVRTATFNNWLVGRGLRHGYLCRSSVGALLT